MPDSPEPIRVTFFTAGGTAPDPATITVWTAPPAVTAGFPPLRYWIYDTGKATPRRRGPIRRNPRSRKRVDWT